MSAWSRCPPRAIALAPGVWRIPTFGRNLINSFAFVESDGSVTLVDAGLRGATRKLVAALAAIDVRPEAVTRILATHAHTDHVGDARRLRNATGGRAPRPRTRRWLRPPGHSPAA